MSHTTTRKTSMKSPEILKKAVSRIPGAQYLGVGEGRRYSGTSHGHQIKLPGWNYPVTVDTQTGQATFDNYGGRWGNEKELDALMQGYAVEAAISQAQLENRSHEEMVLENGAIKITIPLGGGYETDSGSTPSGGWDV